jgi:flagellar L-ring protein precursor FlgH
VARPFGTLTGLAAAFAFGAAVAAASAAEAQNASLYQRDLPTANGTALSVETTSLYYQPPEPLRQIKKHDLITVLVNDMAEVVSAGQMQRRKNATYDAELQDWVLFKGFTMIPDPQSAGSPEINGQLDNQYRATSTLQTENQMSFSITAEVVDIRPNGLLVIEARQWIEENEDTWERALIGIVRPEDVTPANTVTSEKIAELKIYKRETGYVKAGWSRGWFGRIFDVIQPF